MASVLIALTKHLLGNFCRVYTTQIPSVQQRFEEFPLRKMPASRGNDQITYWITDIEQNTIELTLLTKLLKVYHDFPDETLSRIVLIGFPPSEFELPLWINQPTSAGEVEIQIGLKVGRVNRDLIESLFVVVNLHRDQNQNRGRPRNNSGLERIGPNTFRRRDPFGTLIISTGGSLATLIGRGGGIGMGSTVVDLTSDDNNNNNNSRYNGFTPSSIFEQFFGSTPELLPSDTDLVGTRELFSRKRERREDTKEEKEKKRKKLLSRLKLAEEKKSPEEEETRCCCCYEDFYDPTGEYDNLEEQHGDDVFVIPIALVPCQHRLCINCAKKVRDQSKNECPLCKSNIEGWETYYCVSCLKNNRKPKGPNIVVARPCEHRVWCKECAEESITKDNLKCPLCDFDVEDIRVAKEYK